MRTGAVALLLRCCRHSRASTLTSDPLSFSRPLATLTDGEVCAVSAVSMGPSDTTKARKKRAAANMPPRFRQDLGGSERSSHPDAVAAVVAKASPKVKSAAYAQDLGPVVSRTKKTQLRDTDALCLDEFAEAGHNLAAGKSEVLALSTQATLERTSTLKPLAETQATSERTSTLKPLAEIVAKLDLKTYRCGKKWEETAQKLLDYGIPPTYVAKMLAKCSKLFCTVQRVDSTLNQLSLLGMSHVQIGRAITAWPTILNSSDDMFRRKFELLDSIGINRSIFSKGRLKVLYCSVQTLRQHAAVLKDYMAEVHADAVAIMMLKDPEILAYKIQTKLAWFEVHKFEKAMLLKHPHILHSSLRLISSNFDVFRRFGILDAQKWARAVCVVGGVTTSKLIARYDNLSAAGFSRDQLRTIVSTCPNVLALREELINAKLNYAVQVMKLPLKKMVSTTAFWGVSLERRMKPRYKVVKELQMKGARERGVCLSYLISMTDLDFHRKFVERYRYARKHGKALNT